MHQGADGNLEPGFIAFDREIQRRYEAATNKQQAPARSDEPKTVLTLKEAPAQTGPAEEARVRNTPATGSAETAVPSNDTSHLPKEYLDMLEITAEKLKDEDFEMVCTQASKEDIEEFEAGTHRWQEVFRTQADPQGSKNFKTYLHMLHKTQSQRKAKMEIKPELIQHPPRAAASSAAPTRRSTNTESAQTDSVERARKYSDEAEPDRRGHQSGGGIPKIVDFPPSRGGTVSYFCGYKNLVEAKYADKWDRVDPSLNQSQRLMAYYWPSEKEVDILIAADLDEPDQGQNRRLECDETRRLTEREKELAKCMLAAEMVTMVTSNQVIDAMHTDLVSIDNVTKEGIRQRRNMIEAWWKMFDMPTNFWPDRSRAQIRQIMRFLEIAWALQPDNSSRPPSNQASPRPT